MHKQYAKSKISIQLDAYKQKAWTKMTRTNAQNEKDSREQCWLNKT